MARPVSTEILEQAKLAGPHVSALMDENVHLIWDDVQYQERAGFIKIVAASSLFGATTPDELKISRVAVVPQATRRGRIIVNLSAEVDRVTMRGTTRQDRRKRQRVRLNPTVAPVGSAAPSRHYNSKPSSHPSVNETSVPAADQSAVKLLGTALLAIMLFMFDVDCTWEIDWQKIDLSDGFWGMIVEDGKEYNFVYQLPQRAGDKELHYVVPSSLQMGWTNSPPYFCSAT